MKNTYAYFFNMVHIFSVNTLSQKYDGMCTVRHTKTKADCKHSKMEWDKSTSHRPYVGVCRGATFKCMWEKKKYMC